MSDTDDEESHSQTIKITVLGEPSTGKTSLCHRYLGVYGSTPGATQGAEIFAGQCLGLRPPVPIQICDVAGNSLSTNMLTNYLYGSDIVLFVYDLSNLQSFEKLKTWFASVKKNFEGESKNPLMALFGNKSDLEHQRAVRLSCVKTFTSEYLLLNYKGSARTGEMVDHAFTSLIASILGLKVPQLSDADSNSLNHEIKEQTSSSHQTLQEIPTSPLIMNRKTLRKIHRKASSSVCCIQ